MAIHILDEKLINKIAAGEVIERPASVVKELLENAIDAGAKRIEVEVENYGKQLIRIADNGSGMAREDAELCVMRHSTSKIRDEKDLFAISTLGFRGEALASIAAVSNLTIMTRQPESVEGFRTEVEGGKVLSSGSYGCPPGTTVEARNLFFNTPARLKFLKSDTNELKWIVEIVSRYALLYNDIAFKLVHNGHSLLSTVQNNEMLNSIATIYGGEAAKQMLKVDYEDSGAKIAGYISKPSLLKADKSWQSVYVNGRFVKNETVSQALYDSYHSLLFVNMHPVAVLNICLNPSFVDVNVHPAKEIVKFEQATRVYDAVFNALRKTLQDNALLTDYSAAAKKAEPLMSLQRALGPLIKDLDKVSSRPSIRDMRQSRETQKMLEAETIIRKNEQKLKKLPAMKLLGQIAKTYFLAEAADGFLLIDQHVVQERILYETFMAQMMEGNVATQALVNPAVVELSPAEKIIASEHKETLKCMGFEVEEFGGSSFILRSVPTVFSRVQPKELLADALNGIIEKKATGIDRIKEEIITRMACRASIKAGDECSIPQMEALLLELDRTSLPWTCPHGRPIIIKFSKDEIEKMFRRKA